MMDLRVLFEKSELIPTIIQDKSSKQVLMLAYMNEETLELTLKTKKCTFFSRSRQRNWVKGETSGNFQYVDEIYYDCDADTLLILVTAAGPACHTGNVSCFYRKVE